MLLKEGSSQLLDLKNVQFNSEKEVEDIVFKSDTEKVFGEELFIIGRHLSFNDIEDELDALAINKDGELVIIETKKTFYSATTADSQALRYVSYISSWSIFELKEVVEDYYVQKDNNRINFEKKIDDFLDVDISFINQKQKIILIGADNNRKLFSSCAWLKKQGIDIRVFQAEKYIYLKKNNYIDIKEIELAAWLKKHSPKLKSEFNREYHLESCRRDTAIVAEAFVQAIKKLYSYYEFDWSNQTYVKLLDSEKNKIILQFWVNKNFIKVKPSQYIHKGFEKEDVKKEIKKKVDFDITDKIKFA